MKHYVKNISPEKQWDIIKMMLNQRDITTLLCALEDGYKVTPALLEALYRLHFDSELHSVIRLYADKFNLWPIADELLGEEKIDQLKEQVHLEKIAEKNKLKAQEKQHFNQLLDDKTLTDDLLELLLRDPDYFSMAVQVFGEQAIFEAARDYPSYSFEKYLRNFSTDFLIEKECWGTLRERLLCRTIEDKAIDDICQKIAQSPSGFRRLFMFNLREIDDWMAAHAPEQTKQLLIEGQKVERLKRLGLLDYDAWKTCYLQYPTLRKDIIKYAKNIVNKPKFKLFCFLAFSQGKVLSAYQCCK